MNNLNPISINIESFTFTWIVLLLAHAFIVCPKVYSVFLIIFTIIHIHVPVNKCNWNWWEEYIARFHCWYLNFFYTRKLTETKTYFLHKFIIGEFWHLFFLFGNSRDTSYNYLTLSSGVLCNAKPYSHFIFCRVLNRTSLRCVSKEKSWYFLILLNEHSLNPGVFMSIK